jgi:cyclohexanecarboxylate-CoA ligase
MVMTFWNLISTAAAEHPERVVLSDTYGRELTCAALRNASEQVAAGLNLSDDDVVSWQLPTVLESVVLMAALTRVGALQNPIVPHLRDGDVELITGQLHTTKLVVPTAWRGFDHGAMARRVFGGSQTQVITLDLEQTPGPGLRLPLGDAKAVTPPPVDEDGWRWAYYTSGTTAAPKGVRHNDASVIASSHGMTDYLQIRHGDVYPIAWPFTHVGGATMLASVLREGGRLVLFDSFDSAATGARMAEVNPTLLGTAVPFFRAYLEAQLRQNGTPLYPNLRAFVAGGAPVPAGLLRELEHAFPGTPIVNSWGLTEFPIAASSAPSQGPNTTVGRPSPGVRVRVVDGELRLKGPQQFIGYVDSSLDASAFDDAGWFRTGDLGTVDQDGLVTVTGRLKDIIIRNGENVSALEVEEVLRRHSSIADASVIGLPDPRTGERVCAVIVPAHHHKVTLNTVTEHCASEFLARQKTPEQVVIVDSIARNSMGKVLKDNLRSQILTSGEVSDGRHSTNRRPCA